MDKVKNINADRQSPKDKVTPAAQQEGTAAQWGQSGDKTPEAALARDKSSIRNNISPSTNPKS